MATRENVHCELRDRLQQTLESASRAHSAVVGELARDLVVLPPAQRLLLNQRMEDALCDVARARIALEMHQREHRC